MVNEKYLFGAVALLAVVFVGLMLIAGGSNASASPLQQSGSTLSAASPSASASGSTLAPAGCNAAGAGTTAGCGCGGAQTGKLSGCGAQAAGSQKTGCGCGGAIADSGAAATTGSTGSGSGAATTGSATAPAGAQQVSLTATGSGYDKETIYVKAGVPVHFAFTAINAGCGSQLIIDNVGVQLVSRNGQTVYADFTPTAPGSYNYHCGMNMFRGVMIAQ